MSVKDVRKNAKKFVDVFKAEFTVALENARCAKPVPDILEDDNTMNEDRPSHRQGRSKTDVKRAIMEISIGGHTVICLNHATRMSLKVDDKTAAFITSWMLPVMRRVSALPCDVPGVKPTALSQAPSPDSKPTFTLSSSPTPNFKDKVLWNPPKNRWELLLKKPKGVCSEEFSVDPELATPAFVKQKLTVYRQAIKQWNLLDGSGRLRIPVDWEDDAKSEP